MLKYSRIFLIFGFVFLIHSQLPSASFNKSGRSALQFTKIGIGARQAAMGEACIAMVRDVNSVFWNPANITGLNNLEVSFGYVKWIGDLNYLTGAIGYKMGNIGTLALSAGSLDYGDIEEAYSLSPDGLNDTRTGQMFSGSDIVLGLAYARDFTDKFSLGINLKYLREELFAYNVDVFTFDIGTFYDTGFKGIRIAMAAQNFASESVKYLEDSDREEGYDIPLIYRVGVAYNLFAPENSFFDLGESNHLQMSFDALSTNDYGERYHIGAEYILNNFFFLRSGYRFNYAEGNFSAGFGINFAVSNITMKVDYAYVDYDFLDATHRFTVILGL